MDRSETLPNAVLRPLRWAAATVVLFLLVAGTWSGTARIATTIRLPGALQGPKAGFPLQHPGGGRIAHIAVARHDDVAQGDVLLRLDTRAAQAGLISVARQIGMMRVEIALIDQNAALDPGAPLPDGFGLGAPPALVAQLRHRVALLTSQLAVQQQAIDSATEQGQRGQAELDILLQRLDLAERRAARTRDLARVGAVRRVEIEELEDRVLSFTAQRLKAEAALSRLDERRRLAEVEQAVLRDRFAADLAERRARNIKALPEHEERRALLEQEIAQASLYAPFDATVDSIDVTDLGVLAAPGQVLSTLTRRFDDPQVTLFVPLETIDQMRAGMTGKLTLASLPDRTGPDLTVTIPALAHEAERDPAGKPLHYVAPAEVATGDQEAARAQIGDRLRLAAAMPVSVALEGRQITFFEFFTTPIAELFDDAFQND